MDTNNTTGMRFLAGVAGLVFLSGTALLIFEDVIKGAPITQKHCISAIIIAGAMLVGHLAYEAGRAWKIPSAGAFSVLFAACTALVVLSSVGRQGEHQAISQAQADASAEVRATAKKNLARAQGMLAEAQADLAKECKTGRGKRCDGIQRTIDVYEAASAHEQAKLDQIGPVKPVSPDEEMLAEIAGTFGADKAKVKAAAVLIRPFATALVFEFGAIWCLGFAFRGERRQLIPVVETVSKPANDTQLPETDEEIKKLRAFFVAGDGPVTNDQLAERLGVSKGQASKLTTKAVKTGLLQRERLGRNVQIRLN